MTIVVFNLLYLEVNVCVKNNICKRLVLNETCNFHSLETVARRNFKWLNIKII